MAEPREGGLPPSKKRFWMDCPPSRFLVMVARLKEAGARLVTLSVHPEGDNEAGLYYFFEQEGTLYVIRTVTEGRSIGSLFTLFPSADFLERETNDLFGIKFLGHPHLPRMEAVE